MKRSAAITTLMVTLGLLSACTPEADPTPSPTPSATSAAPTPTPSETPTSASPEPSPSPSPSETLDADQQAARDVVNEFFRLYDELRRDPTSSVQPLADITLNEVQTAYLQEIQAFREANAILIGEVSREINTVSASRAFDEEKMVTIEACTDSSGADVVDVNTGESLLPPDRQPVVHWTLEASTLGRTHWYISSLVTDLSGEKCAP